MYNINNIKLLLKKIFIKTSAVAQLNIIFDSNVITPPYYMIREKSKKKLY